MKKSIKILLSVTLCMLVATSSIYASNKIKKEYDFKANDVRALEYSYDKEIKEGFKTYKESSVTYQVIKDNRKKIKKSFSENPPERITEGEVTYERVEKNVKEHIKSEVTYDRDDSIPDEIEKDGVILKLKEKRQEQRSEIVNLPARFYGEEGVNLFKFNNKYISLSNINNPIWQGFNKDVKEHLRLGNNYEVLSGNFVTGYINLGETSYKDAVYQARRTSNVVIATYESEEEYTYVDVSTEKKVDARAIVTYELSSNNNIMAIGGAIIGLLALVISIVIFILKRRNKEDNQ